MARSSNGCPTIALVHTIGKKWTIPIIELLYPPRNRISFNNMQAQLGQSITAKNLSRSLKELCDQGMVKRMERKDNGVLRTEYCLTDKGVALKRFIGGAKELGVNLYGMNPLCADRRCSECTMFTKS